MFKRFLSWLRQVIDKMVGMKNIDEAISSSIVNDEMANAIDEWIDMYMDKAEWLAKNKQTLGLPSTIASEIARLVTLEMEVNISDTNERSTFVKETIKPVIDGIRNYVEYACAGGGLVFKPCVIDGKIEVEYVQANHFMPIAFDSSGRITSAAFMEHKNVGDRCYTRIEKHELVGNKYTITNKAYKSYTNNMIGTECPLSEYEEWQTIEPVVTIENVEYPLFAYFKIPLGNIIDPLSPLGVSVYASARNLIKDADKQYQRFLWEFEGGELAIDVSQDAFKMKDGKPIIPVGRERLFRPNMLDSATSSELFKEWSPTLRDESLLNGLNTILSKIEDKVGLSRGTLSDKYNLDARTAEEIKQTKQRSYATVSDIQKSLQNAIEQLITAVDALATLYELSPEGDIEVAYKWDDSIVIDAATEREVDRQDVRDGFMQKWEYRMKWYGEDEAKAREMTEESKEEEDEEIMFGNKTNEQEE